MFGGGLVGLMGGGTTIPLSSLCCDLDSTLSASYSGSGQTWSNIVTSPADGAAQTDYDFYLGADGAATATDPTFTGSAGTTGAYFALDGGDYFTLKSGTNPSLFKNLAKKTGTPTPFWIAMAFKTPNPLTNTRCMFSTTVDNATNGYMQQANSSTGIDINQCGSAAALQTSSTAGMVSNTNTIVLVSGDFSLTTANLRFWINSRTKDQKNHASEAGSTDANAAAQIARNAVTGILENGYQIRTFAAGNAFLNDDSAVAIFNTLNSRHGITYA